MAEKNAGEDKTEVAIRFEYNLVSSESAVAIAENVKGVTEMVASADGHSIAERRMKQDRMMGGLLPLV